MKMPKLSLRLSGTHAYCGRPGCDEQLGEVVGSGRVFVKLIEQRGEGWTYGPARAYPNPSTAVPARPFEFVRKRRRRINPMAGGPATRRGTLAEEGSVVVCTNPQCSARQVVPSR